MTTHCAGLPLKLGQTQSSLKYEPIRRNYLTPLESLRQNLEIVSLCKILQFSLLNFD